MRAAPATGASEIVEGVLAGSARQIGRAISAVERDGGAPEILRALFPRTGRARVIGVTGPPGAGKSTLVSRLAQAHRRRGRTVAVVAVDPSSPFTGGAILGDRIRMAEIFTDPGVFIRSMATRGTLGGLARATGDAVDVLDAAGYGIVLVETVGVGQDEVDVVQAAHSVVVVSAPGLGDEIQAIKAGVLEIADIHVVSKCDRIEASETVTDLRAMLRLGSLGRAAHSQWKVPVVATSAQKREGIDHLIDAIDAHRTHLAESGELAARNRRILEMRILKAVEDIVRERLLRQNRERLDRLLDSALDRELDPYTAARRLLRLSDGAC
jgi:LAO/AO transport system kinase